MVEPPQTTIFGNSFILYLLLPFLLVFVLVFSILEKTNILGEGKRYANVIVGMVVAFIFVAVPQVVGITIKFIPLIALILVVLLCLLMLFGFVGIKVEESKGLKIALGIVLGLSLLGIFAWSTGIFEKIQFNSTILQYVILVAVFGGAMALVVSGSGKKSSTPSQ
jgi:hypothetical protein